VQTRYWSTACTAEPADATAVPSRSTTCVSVSTLLMTSVRQDKTSLRL
jgi:hypothetical protein